MADMLVNLYEITYKMNIKKEIRIERLIAPDRRKLISFVQENFKENFVDECKVACSNNPITCFVAIKNKKIVGFICYEATAKNFVGPMGVLKEERKQGIGEALMLTCLKSMKDMGYAYAILGAPAENAISFHEKVTNAILIPSKTMGVYTRMIEGDNSFE